MKFRVILFCVLFFVSCETEESSGPVEQGKKASQVSPKEITVAHRVIPKEPEEVIPGKPIEEVLLFSALADFEKKTISETLSKNNESYGHCSAYIRVEPEKFALEWIIDSKGYPKDISIVENKTGNQEVIDCVARTLKTIPFPIFRNGRSVGVIYDFILYKTYRGSIQI